MKLRVWLEQLGGERLGKSEVGTTVARALLRRSEIRGDVAKFLWKAVGREQLARVVRGNLDAFAELGESEIDAWLYELSFGGGRYSDLATRVGSIKALSSRDPARAYRAALQLREERRADCGEILGLLLEIDKKQALELFRAEIEHGEEVIALAAVGEHLQTIGQTTLMTEWLGDPLARVREGACIASEFCPWDDELAEGLRALLYDNDWDVRNAANVALNRLWHAREIERIVDALLIEPEAARRWCLLDIALEDGHPGLWERPSWVARLYATLPLAMRQRLGEELEKRRKSVRDELKKRTRAE
ncbi:MAG: hypothetical protein HC897_00800 [Thermoanaerobaculia bacterium]|nr:hypothetical protein [Thermoanaerobaculia bacterium]